MAHLAMSTALYSFLFLVSGVAGANPTSTTTATAADTQRTANPSSLTLGIGLTTPLGPTDLTVDGLSVEPAETHSLRETINLGWDLPLSRHLSLGPVLQLSSIPLSPQTGLDATLLDTGLRAKFRVAFRSDRPRIELVPTAVLASTWSPSGRSPINRRIVTSTTSSELGWSAGFSFGLAVAWEVFGGYVDIGYRHQGANFAVSQVLANAPELESVSEHSYGFSTVAVTTGVILQL